ncbi:S1C family serine protease [Jannaschia seohaensis]|uniref:S1-C subfamily serine protease n=1 Tax=Jannaschia seohaensis TaxID=475081 RepID=A0A2Y9AQ18_9RHOB|nr:trypsin-like peptidase domain-containing protein [Jannaschia seohaensis]PWJ20452.1 S1-C subfamily serine protease [Jannaschia seohaensis]SSA44547.1 serine protease, S1-C subfamily, contains C-terminal PDZ domain [Jannaschia seohaensis]
MRGLLAVLLVAFGAMLGAALSPYIPALIRPAPAPVVVTPRGDLGASERATVELFQAAQSSVVFISTTTRGMDLFRGSIEMPSGTGSGFVWDDMGHIITNAHVIRGASSATVRLPGGRAVPARLVGLDRRHDLAVLRVSGMGMRPLPLGRSANLQVGQSVFAIGNPFGLDFTLTTGIVSAIDREIPGEDGLTIRGLIQTDAAINPGNSGGPLLDSAGRLIGVNTAIFSPSGASAGIGFAVPVDTVARVVPQLIATGSYAPPSLGISADRRADMMLGESGVMVLDVASGGPAARAGLEPARLTNEGLIPRDVIEAIDGEPVRNIDDLLAVLDTKRAGQAVALKVRRGRDRREVTVTLAP